MDAGYAPSTVHKAHQILAKVLDSAVKSSRLGRNVTEQTELPTIERREQRFLTPAEVSRLDDAIDPRYRALVLVGAYGGLRPGEMYALRRSRVDLLAGTVEVAETLTEVSGHLHFGPPKTRAGHRVVPLPRTVVSELEGHVAPIGADELVFTAPKGGPIRRGQFRKRKWLAAVESAEVTPLRIHDLRHTAVAFWIAAGASPSEIARRAGHTSVSVVLDRYGHLLPTTDDAVTDRLDVLAQQGAEEATVVDLEARRRA